MRFQWCWCVLKFVMIYFLPWWACALCSWTIFSRRLLLKYGVSFFLWGQTSFGRTIRVMPWKFSGGLNLMIRGWDAFRWVANLIRSWMFNCLKTPSMVPSLKNERTIWPSYWLMGHIWSHIWVWLMGHIWIASYFSKRLRCFFNSFQSFTFI